MGWPVEKGPLQSTLKSKFPQMAEIVLMSSRKHLMSIRLVTKSVWGNPGNRGKRIRKTLDALVWQLQKRILRSSRILKLPNGVLFKAYPDCVVSSALIYADWPEYYELVFLRQELQSNDIIIDVGAYVGHISLLLADVVGPRNILAFEPAPVSFQRLLENWQLNGWATQGLFQAAVGAKAGSVFVRDLGRPLSTETVSNSPHKEHSVEVPLVRLDDFRYLWQGQPIGLLKIDVEGYEAKVFRGSRQLLEQDRPRFILFESLSGSLDQEIASLLAGSEYIVFQLDSKGRPDFARDSAQNLFAIPKEHWQRFGA